MKTLMKTIRSLQRFRKPACGYVVAVNPKQRSWGKSCPGAIGPVRRGSVWAPLGTLRGDWLLPALVPSEKWPRRPADPWVFPEELHSLQLPIRVSAGLALKGRPCAVPQQTVQGCAALDVKDGASDTSHEGYGGLLQSVSVDGECIQG